MQKSIYFDHAATTAVDEKVLMEMLPYFTVSYGNPSSAYEVGRRNKMAIENARKKVANVINAKNKEIFFTGGGSESDNLALKGVIHANKNSKKHRITNIFSNFALRNRIFCKQNT